MPQNRIDYTKGFVTLPAETGKEKAVFELVKKWGADALRDSDGTSLSPEILEMGFNIYSTLCLVRYDQKWAKKNPSQLIQKYLMSEPQIAFSEALEIDLLEGFFRKKYKIDDIHSANKWWSVIDRTTGNTIDISQWEYHKREQKLTIHNCEKFHKYTVNFLVYQTWDTTSMYNHLTNNWTCEPFVAVDPYHLDTRKHLLKVLDEWLASHPNTDVVRLTSLFYHFTLDSDENGKDKYVDGDGYTDCISPQAIKDFKEATGLNLSSEDMVDQGYYNASYRCPSSKYLAWMEFVHKFVITYGAEIVEHIHNAGKKAALFLGDHYVGVEPYSPEYKNLNIDIEIGAPGNGIYLRRLADIPGSQIKEGRFYPYLFPNIFEANSNPVEMSYNNWIKVRRAILRKPIDRIGYGGYLSLALKFPEFIEHVSSLCNEFRKILEKTEKTPAYTANIKIGVLNAWGKLRSWSHYSIISEKCFSGDELSTKDGFLECLSGLPVEVEFLSFNDIYKNGVPKGINVIINAGDAGTAWSGDNNWADPTLTSVIREWVYKGGGFIGINDPSAYEYQGGCFQLSDVLGVQKETGKSIYSHPINIKTEEGHFITEDLKAISSFKLGENTVYPITPDLKILARDKQKAVSLSTNAYGKGKAVYISDLPYNSINSRVLLRTLFWVSNQEEKLKQWFSSNPETECAAYPQTGNFIIINNNKNEQESVVYKENDEQIKVKLNGYESKWFKI